MLGSGHGEGLIISQIFGERFLAGTGSYISLMMENLKLKFGCRGQNMSKMTVKVLLFKIEPCNKIHTPLSFGSIFNLNILFPIWFAILRW